MRSSMNSLATLLGVTCTADIGLMSIEYTCFDGTDCYSQSLCLTNTGVNTSKLNRLERFVNDFDHECCTMSGEQIHTYLDQIEQIHGLYSPFALGCASALACSAFTFYSAADLLKCSVPSLVPALKLSAVQTDKTSFYTVSLHCSIRLKCLSGLCRTVKNCRAAVGNLHSA